MKEQSACLAESPAFREFYSYVLLGARELLSVLENQYINRVLDGSIAFQRPPEL